MARKVNRNDVQSLFAKILAAEGITVVYANVKEPNFHLRDRVLTMPYWATEKFSQHVFDMLTAHEIGHALYTPPEAWEQSMLICNQNHVHDEKKCYDLNFQNFINVCDDARQEKLVKRKYPGLKAVFAKAYKEIFDADLFGVKNVNPSMLPLIDRINLYFKVGAHHIIHFNRREQKFVDRLTDCESFEDCVQIARDIYEQEKQNPSQIQNMQDLMDAKSGKMQPQEQNGENDESGDQQSGCDSNDDEGDKDSKGKKSKGQKPKKSKKKDKPEKSEKDKCQGGQKGDQDEDEDESEGGGSGEDEGDDQDEGDEDQDGGGQGEDDEGDEDGESDGDGDGESDDESDGDGDSDQDGDQENGQNQNETSRNPNDRGGQNNRDERDNKGSEVQPMSITDQIFRQRQGELNSKTTVVNATVPDIDLSRTIYTLDKVVEFYERCVKPQDGQYEQHSKAVLAHVLGLHRDHINLLVKEFEMRKNAKDYYRQETHRTGELDEYRLAEYRLTADIFRRVTEVPKGKSHGMVMFIDMSSSMDGSYMFHAVEQLIILATFCQKVRIPFDAYGFADSLQYPALPAKSSRQMSRNSDIQMGSRGFHLRHLLSSSVSTSLYSRALRMLAYYMGKHRRGAGMSTATGKVFQENVKTSNEGGLSTGGTPLSECIIASQEIINRFKQNHRVDITNVIYLTDGAGNHLGLPYNGLTYEQRSQMQRVIITDPKTKQFLVSDANNSYSGNANVQELLTRLMKQVTGCRHIGYYICDKGQVDGMVGQFRDQKARARAQKTAMEFGFVEVPMLGFDHYYYISPVLMGAPELSFQGVHSAEQAGEQLASGMRRKKAARVILSQFAQQIGTTEGLEDRL